MSKPPVIILEGPSSAGKTTLCNNLVELDVSTKWEVDGLDILSKELGSPSQAFQKILEANPDSREVYDKLMSGETRDKFANGIIDISVFEGKLRDSNNGAEYSESERAVMQQLIDRHSVEFKEAVPNFERRMGMLCERALDRSNRGIATILDVFPPADSDRGTDIVKAFKSHWPDENTPPLLVVGAHCDLEKISSHMDMRNSSGDRDEERKTFGPFNQYGAMFVATDDPAIAVGSLTVAEVRNAAQKFGDDPKNNEANLLTSLGLAKDTPESEVIKISPRQPSRYDLIVQTDAPRGAESTKDVSIESARLISQAVSENAKESLSKGMLSAIAEAMKNESVLDGLSDVDTKAGHVPPSNLPAANNTNERQ